MKKFLFLLTFYLCSEFAFGQKINFTVNEIDSIVKRIDSTCISGGITDYTFRKSGHKKKVIGGGADWYYTDTSRVKLLKVVQEMSLETENFDTYYFYQDSLIYLKTINASYVGDKRTINWTRQCYFQNGTLLLRQDNLKITFIPQTYINIAKDFFIGNKIWRK